MTAASWARDYSDALLARLETEANEGWPDLSWPPMDPPGPPDPEQVAVLRRLLALLGDCTTVYWSRSQRQQAQWLHSGRTRDAAA